MGRPSAERRPSLDRPTTEELGYIEKYEYGAAHYVVDPRSHNTNPAELFEGTGFAWTMVATGAKQFEAVAVVTPVRA